VTTTTAAPTCKPGTCEPPQAIIDAAKKEGSLTMYSALGASTQEALSKKFEEKYGVKVVYSEVKQAESTERVQQEADAKKRVADLVPLGEPGVFADWLKAGVIRTFTTTEVPNAAGLSADSFKDNAYIMWGGPIYTLGWNKNTLPNKTAPTGYCELTDPVWKGKVGMTFQPGSTSFVHYGMIRDACGADYFKKLKANDVRIYPATTNATEALAAGEFAVLINAIPYQFSPFQDKGAPLDWTIPPQGATISTRWTAIVKDSPHPNAALLFMNFVLSTDGQQIAFSGKNLGYAIISGVKDTIDPTGKKFVFADLAKAKVIEPSITADIGK
jgi:iron(III) transport system substrate-binding protein